MKIHPQTLMRFKNEESCPTEVPDSLLNEDWAKKIHGQSLHVLNDRGGMSINEILANIKRLPSSTIGNETVGMLNELKHILQEYDRNHLIKKRVQVIGDYPYSPWEKGDILTPSEDGELYGAHYNTGYVASKAKVNIQDVHKYPTIFRFMNWYEFRSKEDLSIVKYIKGNPDSENLVGKSDVLKEVYKVAQHEVSDDYACQYCSCYTADGVIKTISYEMILPATEEEYDNYINKYKKFQ